MAVLSGLLITLWCTLALAYAPAGPNQGTLLLALGYLGLVLAIVWRVPGRAWRHLCLALAWGAVLLWFLLVPAPGEAAWLPEGKVAPQLTISGDLVSVSGIRDFGWHGPNQFDARWREGSYDLNRLRSADVFLSFWGPQRICHTFVSFGFEKPDGSLEQVVVSIEVRKHEGQSYAALASTFRQFSLVYVWATETDVVRVRTNFRDEQVFRYALRISPERLRQVFLNYVHESQRLHDHPRWYNAVTESCGVDILRIVWGNQIGYFPTLAQLLNGTWERQAYQKGRLDRSQSFESLRAQANITAAARAASLQDFSTAIRQNNVWLTIHQ